MAAVRNTESANDTLQFDAEFAADTLRFDADFSIQNGPFDAVFNAATIIGGALPSNARPLMDGEASPGESTRFSRADHVHPHDTTKQDRMIPIPLADLARMFT